MMTTRSGHSRITESPYKFYFVFNYSSSVAEAWVKNESDTCPAFFTQFLVFISQGAAGNQLTYSFCGYPMKYWLSREASNWFFERDLELRQIKNCPLV